MFDGDERIAAVYLFGSHAEGVTHPGSDFDIGVLVKSKHLENFSLDDELDLEVKVSLALNTDNFDLVFAHKTTIAMRYRILNPQHLIFEFDEEERIEQESRAVMEYLDFSYYLNKFYEGQKHTILSESVDV